MQINQILLWSLLVISLGCFFLTYQVSRDFKKFYETMDGPIFNEGMITPTENDLKPFPKNAKFKPKVNDDNTLWMRENDE